MVVTFNQLSQYSQYKYVIVEAYLRGSSETTAISYIGLDLSFKVLLAIFGVTLGIFFLNFMKAR